MKSDKNARKRVMRKKEKSVALGEFCKLRKCVFESVEEGLHAIHETKTQI